AEAFAPDLEADVQLCHGGIADVGAFFVDTAVTVRAAHDESTFADAGKHRIAVAIIKKGFARAGLLEELNGLGVVIGPPAGGAAEQYSTGKKGNTSLQLHHGSPGDPMRTVIQRGDAHPPQVHITYYISPIRASPICAAADSRQDVAARGAARRVRESDPPGW